MQYGSIIAVSLVYCFSCIAASPEQQLVRSVRLEGTKRSFTFKTQAGQPLDSATVMQDVRHLWATGAFDDVRVESKDAPDHTGTNVVFYVVEKPRIYLNKIKLDPHSGSHAPPIEAGTLMDPARAQQVAARAQQDLVQDGYRDAKVEAELVPAGARKVDLHLHENAGTQYRVQEIKFTGDLALDQEELAHALRATRVHRIIPLIWTRHPPYSEDAVASDIDRLRSLYISHGYLEPQIKVDSVDYNKNKTLVTLDIKSGTRYGVTGAQLAINGQTTNIPVTANGAFPNAAFCACLFDRRHTAEKEGRMDFAAQMRLTDAAQPESAVQAGSKLQNWVSLDTSIDTGPPFTVRRIDIVGSKRFSDTVVRRALVLDEGDVFDWSRLRRSLSRVNDMGYFEPLGDGSLNIKRNEADHSADVTIKLKDKPIGRWFLSGPVGPASVAGPLQAVIQTRLPAWGRGIFEASTYFATFSYIGFASPMWRFMPGSVAGKTFFPLFVLERPYMPGQWWLSGFALSPQLGWQGALLSYGTNHFYAAARNALGDGSKEPELAVPVERVAFDGTTTKAGYLICAPAKSRWSWLGTGARTVLNLWFGARPF